MESRIQTKLNEIKNKIQKNITNYDLNQIYNLLDKLDNELGNCVKIDYKILDFFRSKNNFRIIQDLKDFGLKKLKFQAKEKRRIDIENKLAQYVSSKGIQLKDLLNLLGKSEIKAQKTQLKTTQKKIIIDDQASKWIGLTSKELIDELNNLDKYPDSTSLKKAANSILLPNEKRLRKREKIIRIIIKRISEDKAIAQLGR